MLTTPHIDSYVFCCPGSIAALRNGLPSPLIPFPSDPSPVGCQAQAWGPWLCHPLHFHVGPTPVTCYQLAWEVAQLAEGWPQVMTVTFLAAGCGHSLPDKFWPGDQCRSSDPRDQLPENPVYWGTCSHAPQRWSARGQFWRDGGQGKLLPCGYICGLKVGKWRSHCGTAGSQEERLPEVRGPTPWLRSRCNWRVGTGAGWWLKTGTARQICHRNVRAGSPHFFPSPSPTLSSKSSPILTRGPHPQETNLLQSQISETSVTVKMDNSVGDGEGQGSLAGCSTGVAKSWTRLRNWKTMTVISKNMWSKVKHFFKRHTC